MILIIYIVKFVLILINIHKNIYTTTTNKQQQQQIFILNINYFIIYNSFKTT